MAWGKAKTQPPLRSTITQLLPLIITLVVLSVVGWVCYQVYISLIKIKAQAEKQMGENNVVFTKDGLRVNMKDVRTESYLDATQSWFVKAWDLSGNAVDKSKRKRNVLTKQRSPDISNQSNTS